MTVPHLHSFQWLALIGLFWGAVSFCINVKGGSSWMNNFT